jgi:surface polysaccharide O-acyltransferase-like enzyme
MDKVLNVSSKTRFAYLDNIRSLVIILVVAMHTAVTYSGFGGWYYIENSTDKLNAFELPFFGFTQSFGQAWFMGILFFISAYLAVKSLNRRGAKEFIKERLFRLGLPLLIYMFLINPFNMYVLLRYNLENTILENYRNYIVNLWWVRATGPLWFAQVLLFFCIVYVIVKKTISKTIKINEIKQKSIVFCIIITGITAFLIRLIYPIGTNFYNLQFCYFASYIVLFILGIIVGENNLMENITDKKNIKWVIGTVLLALPLWTVITLFGGVLEGKMYFNGGLYWQSFAYAFWEAAIAIGFSIGLIALFKKKLDIENKFTRLIRDNAFGIYCFHSPILIAVTLAMKSLVFLPILKFLIALIIASVLCLVFSFFVRKIKPIGILLK